MFNLPMIQEEEEEEVEVEVEVEEEVWQVTTQESRTNSLGYCVY